MLNMIKRNNSGWILYIIVSDKICLCNIRMKKIDRNNYKFAVSSELLIRCSELIYAYLSIVIFISNKTQIHHFS